MHTPNFYYDDLITISNNDTHIKDSSVMVKRMVTNWIVFDDLNLNLHSRFIVFSYKNCIYRTLCIRDINTEPHTYTFTEAIPVLPVTTMIEDYTPIDDVSTSYN